MEKTAQELKNEYLRNWRKTHKENVKQHNKNYWDKKAKLLEESEVN